MGDLSCADDFAQASAIIDAFKANSEYRARIRSLLDHENKINPHSELARRLGQWDRYFSLQSFSDEAKTLKQEIDAREASIQTAMANLTSGYTNPYTGEFHQKTWAWLGMMMATNDDGQLRKAAFMGREETSAAFVEDLIRLVNARNRFARLMGYDHFYDYKAQTEERMSAQEIWSLFEEMIPFLTIPHAEIREMESVYPDLREPREFAYRLNGDSLKRDDPYFPLETILDVWGRSFTGLGISYRGATMNLDLLERKGKYNNGFCHSPRPVSYRDNQRSPCQINFTCTAIVGQIGSGQSTGNTLFHEGGHAAHFANMDCQDVILNTEYIPQSVAWAETQSMFLDDIFDNIQRKCRYAKTLDGTSYPFHFFDESVRKTYVMRGRSMLGIASVVLFEKFLYTAREDELTPATVCAKARELSVTLFDQATPSLRLLTIPHIYSRNSSCYYHGYGMATLAVEQRKKYFTDRDGYLVDNHRIGPEMMAVWALWSSKPSSELFRDAFWSSLSTTAFLTSLDRSPDQVIADARRACSLADDHSRISDTIDLDCTVALVEGESVYGTNEAWWESLSAAWKQRLRKT